jgi:hypothetical protein
MDVQMSETGQMVNGALNLPAGAQGCHAPTVALIAAAGDYGQCTTKQSVELPR